MFIDLQGFRRAIHQSKFSVPYIKVHSYFVFPQTALSAQSPSHWGQWSPTTPPFRHHQWRASSVRNWVTRVKGRSESTCRQESTKAQDSDPAIQPCVSSFLHVFGCLCRHTRYYMVYIRLVAAATKHLSHRLKVWPWTIVVVRSHPVAV